MVIPQETDEGDDRELQRTLVWAGAPYCRSHWNEVVVAKGLRVSLSREVLPNARISGLRSGVFLGLCWVVLALVILCQNIESKLVESDDVEDESPHSQTEYIAPLCEYG